ncbi:MAG: M20/M25/M40 family metallo-hydrolase [Sphingomonas fennica]
MIGALAALGLAGGAAAQGAPSTAGLRPDQQAFLGLYKELVETDTTLSAGSCTLAAERMAARLKAAGYADRDLTLFADPAHPKEGGLVAVLAGSDAALKPLLLLAHIDVVEAKRADWTRDPFTLIEEKGYYYARGSADDKAMAATFTDAMIRLKKAGRPPKRTVKLALTCGEETTYAFNGADWLAKNRPELIAAGFALNEGGGGRLNGAGEVASQSVQVGEKAVQNYRIEAMNAGGHSSVPIKDNAIYELADALVRLRDHEFPIRLNDTTRAYFTAQGKAMGGEMGAAMQAIAANPQDAAADRIVSADRAYHSMLRTTCVATLLDGGHANNALPQRAGANVNCRIIPGETVEGVRTAITAAIADPKMTVAVVPPIRPAAKAPPLDPKVIGPMEAVAKRYFPDIAIVPSMSTGGTDGPFLGQIGIPVYGVPGFAGNGGMDGVHGLNERIQVKALYRGRDYLNELVDVYAAGG